LGSNLGERVTAGCEADDLVKQHLPLVEHLVMKISAGFPRHVDRSELVSAGILGLVEAAQRFDADRGTPFSSFASVRIRGAVLDVARASDWVPRAVRAAARTTEQQEQALASRLGRAPTVEELAETTGMSVDELASLRDRVHRGVVMALDRMHGEGEAEEPLVARIADPRSTDPLEELEGAELRAYVRDAVAVLPERHRVVIVGYFLEGRTSEEIAEELGVTQSRVSQLRADALDMLREGIEAQYKPRPSGRPVGRVARRQARFAAEVANASSFKARITTGSPPVVVRSA
jgi:RNA polymerase sigma factor for flagellar operon FliA